jgi:predicted ATPase
MRSDASGATCGIDARHERPVWHAYPALGYRLVVLQKSSVEARADAVLAELSAELA